MEINGCAVQKAVMNPCVNVWVEWVILLVLEI